MASWATAVRLTLLLTVPAPISVAQDVVPDVRPGDERPELPPLEPPKAQQRPILPRYPMPQRPERDGVVGGVKVFVREIRITGNTAVSSEDLAKIAAPYQARALTSADLQELGNKLTLVYVERGYVTSGAVLPNQTIRDGTLEIQIVEGRLEEVEVETEGRFRPSYIRSRLQRGPPGPVNVFTLEKRLQILQQDPRLLSVEAQLVPAETRGFSILRVSVTEAPPLRLSAEFDDYRSPAIGALGGSVLARLDNAIGIGDTSFVRGTFSEGLRQVESRFQVPLTAYDTLLTLRYQGSWADVVDGDFVFLDIRSRSESFGVELRQPLYRSLRTSIEGFVRGDRRRAESTLGLFGIGLPILGAENGISKVTALRFGVEGTYRTRRQVLYGRSLLSWGIDALGATVNPGDIPDSRFLAWLLQLQWAQRLPWLDAELVTRFDTQLANDPLLPLEQFAMGGRFTVRGYHENQVVSDNGLVGSVEVRVPIFQRAEPMIQLELVPFFDAGHSWNTEIPSVGQQTLMSVGVGTRVLLPRRGRLEFYWGHRLKDVAYIGEHNLQDDGIYFRVGVDWP